MRRGRLTEQSGGVFGNGLAVWGIIGLVHLGQSSPADCSDRITSMNKLARMRSDTIRCLELNADSMPDDEKRYRARSRAFWTFAFTCSMALWKIHSLVARGLLAGGEPNRIVSQHDHITTLHTLGSVQWQLSWRFV